MSNVIKIKRSETEASVPSTSDLAVGEDSNDSIIAVANFSKADPNQVFPTGDYGDLTNPDTDAFNVIITASFDCLTKPTAALVTEDFGSI